MTVSYPPKNSIITFREPFPRIERYSVDRNGIKFIDPHSTKYYIKVSIDDQPEKEIRIDRQQQLDVIDYLISVDEKLTSAEVRCDSQGRFVVLQHSPQEDFFDLVKEEKCTQ